jgi:hypothetical protein
MKKNRRNTMATSSSNLFQASTTSTGYKEHPPDTALADAIATSTVS